MTARSVIVFLLSLLFADDTKLIFFDRIASQAELHVGSLLITSLKNSSGSNRKNEESHALFLRRNFTLSLSVYDILQWTDRPGCVCLCVSRVPGTD